ncbi:MAG: glycosyltransferase family 39 protein [Acidobacteriota bacterium]|nr:glycosyltransferase family 39 protein [Acidobacteriota bacterium]
MRFQLTMRRLAIIAAAALIAALYLADLGGMGLVSKDEPRYADIGRAMARTGDWITPRLWGQPWFEKPPLLYWLIALGFKAGLGPETAPRVPVALLSLGFLVFFWFRVRQLWDERTANYSAAILATSAGWVAIAHVAITDIPVAVFFNVAVLLFLSGKLKSPAAALGVAVLAKSLPPLVFFSPLLAMEWRRWREWLRPAPLLIFLAIALPWHVVTYLRNGYEFVRVLFIEQQFGRFLTPERQHVQPWWFYLPVLLLFLFPWFPLLPASARVFGDRKIRMLGAMTAFGMVFLSTALNKLPGYVLPLLPGLAIAMGAGMSNLARPEGPDRGRYECLSIALLGILPAAAQVVPVALGSRLSNATLPWSVLGAGLCVSSVIAFGVRLARGRSFEIAFGLTCAMLIWFQFRAFPDIDRLASARNLWLREHPGCTSTDDRGELYGLYYYAGGTLPPCGNLDPNPAAVVR